MNKQNLSDYIRCMYKLAKSDVLLAKDEDTEHKARLELLRLNKLASDCIGFEFADSLERI